MEKTELINLIEEIEKIERKLEQRQEQERAIRSHCNDIKHTVINSLETGNLLTNKKLVEYDREMMQLTDEVIIIINSKQLLLTRLKAIRLLLSSSSSSMADSSQAEPITQKDIKGDVGSSSSEDHER